MRLIATLILSMLALPAFAVDITAEVTVPVELPTLNVDGSELTDLDHIDVYYGLAAGDHSLGSVEMRPNNPNPAQGDTVNVTFQAVVPDGSSVFYVATATDVDGSESGISNEGSQGPFTATNVPSDPPVLPGGGTSVIVSCPPGWTCTVSSSQP